MSHPSRDSDRKFQGRLRPPKALGPSVPGRPDGVGTMKKDTVRDQVFISYSRQDKRFLDDLLKHLKPHLRMGAITAWSDRQIRSGSKWFDEIEAALARTSVAVLLVSPDFLASDFIHQHELGPLLKEADAGGVKIRWVLIHDCAYNETLLKDFQAVVSPPDKPFAQIRTPQRATAWRKVCEEIKQATSHP
jgi:internalin A